MRRVRMKLVIVGGGGFRVPLICRALSAGPFAGLIGRISLVDVDQIRANAVARVCADMPSRRDARTPAVEVEPSLIRALAGADMVFAAIRSGGTAGRVLDERVAIDHGLLGQETVGAGGLSYALRSIPDMMAIARTIRDQAPTAWLINFTNPVGMVTEAVREVLGERVIGICDSPAGLLARTATACGVTLPFGSLTGVDYLGVNHLGWLRNLAPEGEDLLPGLLSDPARLQSFEEGRLFGPSLPRLLGALPNEYLFYYYHHREARRTVAAADRTRGEQLHGAQDALFRGLTDTPDPYRLWESARREREAGYLAEARPATAERDESDLAGGGYERIALAAMRSLITGEPADLILNVRNGGAIAALPPAAVVEVPARVSSTGAQALPLRPATTHQAGLVAAVKASEQALTRAACTQDRDAALLAFTLHPLIDSAHVATSLLAAYEEAFPRLKGFWAH